MGDMDVPLLQMDGAVPPEDGGRPAARSLSSAAERANLEEELAGAGLEVSEVRRMSAAPLDEQRELLRLRKAIRDTAPMLTFNVRRYTVAGRDILRGVEGDARPGEVLAVFGPSGSGKTTLLELMAGRVESGAVSGTVLYDGMPLDRNIARLVGFCPQSDAALVGSLTVEETFRFAAELTLPQSVPERFKQERIDETLRQLGLERVRHSRIGGVFQRGLSGGEKRRVSLGTQLIKRPRVLYLDEPTSGLDSYTAAKVMIDVQRLARELNITVVCTLHQPNPHVMEAVDRVLLLVHGRCAVLGTPDECAACVREAGGEVRAHDNIADVLLDFANPDFDSTANTRIDKLRAQSLEALSRRNGGASFSRLGTGLDPLHEAGAGGLLAALDGESAWTNTSHQFRTLLWRFGVVARRDPLIFWVRFSMIQFMALVIGALYFDLDDSYESIGDLVSAFFFMTLVTTFVSLTALPHCASEKFILRHEYKGRLYHLRSYVGALVASRVAVLTVINVIFAVVAYNLIGVGRSSPGQFSFFLSILLVANVFAELLMLCVGALLRDPIAGIAVSVTNYGFFMLMSGTFVTPDRMTAFMRPVTFISYYKYVLEGMMHNAFPHLVFRCPSVLAGTPDYEHCRVSGNEVLEKVYKSGGAYFTGDKWTCFFVLVGLAALTLLVYYRLLRRLLDRRPVDESEGDGGAASAEAEKLEKLQ